jgi:Cu/Ag efflux pump CusA
MVMIREIAQIAMATGNLSLANEQQLRLMLKQKYEIEDLDAFISLQQAVIQGQVKQQSRQKIS